MPAAGPGRGGGKQGWVGKGGKGGKGKQQQNWGNKSWQPPERDGQGAEKQDELGNSAAAAAVSANDQKAAALKAQLLSKGLSLVKQPSGGPQEARPGADELARKSQELKEKLMKSQLMQNRQPQDGDSSSAQSKTFGSTNAASGSWSAVPASPNARPQASSKVVTKAAAMNLSASAAGAGTSGSAGTAGASGLARLPAGGLSSPPMGPSRVAVPKLGGGTAAVDLTAETQSGEGGMPAVPVPKLGSQELQDKMAQRSARFAQQGSQASAGNASFTPGALAKSSRNQRPNAEDGSPMSVSDGSPLPLFGAGALTDSDGGGANRLQPAAVPWMAAAGTGAGASSSINASSSATSSVGLTSSAASAVTADPSSGRSEGARVKGGAPVRLLPPGLSAPAVPVGLQVRPPPPPPLGLWGQAASVAAGSGSSSSSRSPVSAVPAVSAKAQAGLPVPPVGTSPGAAAAGSRPPVAIAASGQAVPDIAARAEERPLVPKPVDL
ncbi:unnamed protein product, partial [Polarella glacialis]